MTAGMKESINHVILRFWILAALCCTGTASAVTATDHSFSEQRKEVVAGQTRQNDRDYQLRTPGTVFLDQFKNDKAFHYITKTDKVPDWWRQFRHWLLERLFRTSSPLVDKWLDIAIKTIAILLAIFLIYKIVRSKFSFPITRRESLFDTTDMAVQEPVDSLSYPTLLQKAVLEKNYEIAVQIHYMYLLYLLDQKGIIRWNRHKTNTMYVYEIEDRNRQLKFKQLGWIFDCVCYGEFKIDELAYRQVAFRFETFQKELV